MSERSKAMPERYRTRDIDFAAERFDPYDARQAKRLGWRGNGTGWELMSPEGWLPLREGDWILTLSGGRRFPIAAATLAAIAAASQESTAESGDPT